MRHATARALDLVRRRALISDAKIPANVAACDRQAVVGDASFAAIDADALLGNIDRPFTPPDCMRCRVLLDDVLDHPADFVEAFLP